MSERLTYERLLHLLQVNHSHEAMKLCRPVLGLCRRRRFSEAIQQANSAILLARANYSIVGVALLYLSFVQQAFNQESAFKLAVRDCDRAVRLLSLHRTNQAIAYIFRANLELAGEGYAFEYRRGDDWSGRPQSLGYLQQADNLLLEQIKYEQEHNRSIRWYSVLEALVCQKMEAIKESLRCGLPWEDHVMSGCDEASQVEHAVFPADLAWPAPNPAIQLEVRSAALEGAEVSRVFIDGLPYRIAVYTLSSVQPGSIRWSKEYQAWPVLDNSYHQFILVREQRRPNRDRQLVAFYDSATCKAWIDWSQSNEPYTDIHIVGLKRDWRINDRPSGNPIVLGTPYMIGVVEAFLIPE